MRKGLIKDIDEDISEKEIMALNLNMKHKKTQ